MDRSTAVWRLVLTFPLLHSCDAEPPKVFLDQRSDLGACVSLTATDLALVPSEQIEMAQADWTLGSIESPLHMLGSAAFLATGDLLLLSDAGRTLDVFDGATGARVASVGRTGRGPGEFLQVFGFNVLSHGRIAVPDYQNSRVVYFEPDLSPGEVLPYPPLGRSTQPLVIVRGIVHDSVFVMTVRDVVPRRTRSGRLSVEEALEYLVVLDRSHRPNRVRESSSYRAVLDGAFLSGPPLAPSRRTELGADRLAWVAPDGLSVFVSDSSGESPWCVAWRGPFFSADGALNALQKDARSEGEAGAGRARLIEALRAEGLTLAHVPVFNDVRLTPDGWLWVELLTEPVRSTATGREVLLLTRDGRPVRRVRLPVEGDATLLAASEDQLVLHWRRSLDVEYLGLFTIGPVDGAEDSAR